MVKTLCCWRVRSIWCCRDKSGWEVGYPGSFPSIVKHHVDLTTVLALSSQQWPLQQRLSVSMVFVL